MAEVKAERREISFRIVYFGSEAATKFANLRSVHDALSQRGDGIGEISTLLAGGDRVLGFRHAPPMKPIYGMKVGFEVFTIPGEIKSGSNEKLLLAAADAIIYLDDRSDDQGGPAVYEALLDAMAGLNHKPEDIPFFVQCYRETPDERAQFYRRKQTDRWQPKVRRISATPLGALEVFDEIEAEVAALYARYQGELKKAGLESHLKIRDRVYERVRGAAVHSEADSLSDSGQALAISESLVSAESPRKPSIGRFGGFLLVLFAIFLIALAAWFASTL